MTHQCASVHCSESTGPYSIVIPYIFGGIPSSNVAKPCSSNTGLMVWHAGTNY
jgi:hypothetical protein